MVRSFFFLVLLLFCCLVYSGDVVVSTLEEVDACERRTKAGDRVYVCMKSAPWGGILCLADTDLSTDLIYEVPYLGGPHLPYYGLSLVYAEYNGGLADVPAGWTTKVGWKTFQRLWGPIPYRCSSFGGAIGGVSMVHS